VKESETGGRQDKVARRGSADSTTIHSLIADLASKDGRVRERARKSLVAERGRAVSALIGALADQREQVRWEAAKALGCIGDPSSGHGLVRTLEDEDPGVRWLAAEALVAIGLEALVPLLQALIERADSLWLREGAHHVVHNLARKNTKEFLLPLLAALEDIDPSVKVPLAVRVALDGLTKAKG
jgi:HEAT repeat protein